MEWKAFPENKPEDETWCVIFAPNTRDWYYIAIWQEEHWIILPPYQDFEVTHFAELEPPIT